MFCFRTRHVKTSDDLFLKRFLLLIFLGNLALSRALGDFVFKKNDKMKAEEQIVTGNVGLRLNLIFIQLE